MLGVTAQPEGWDSWLPFERLQFCNELVFDSVGDHPEATEESLTGLILEVSALVDSMDIAPCEVSRYLRSEQP